MTEFNEKTISNAIHTKWAGKTVHFAEETDSTNEWIKRLAAEQAPHGTVAAAEFQSAGKGRLGRSWTAPVGSSVMFSILLRPDFAPEIAPMLTLVMGLSVAQAVSGLGLVPSIKWPNDVVLSRKKICGILTEMSLAGNRIDYVVIGTGVNVNIAEIPEELSDKATSLFLETGMEYDRCRVLGEVLSRFENNYEKFAASGDLSLLIEEYHSFLANRNQPVRVLDGEHPYEGKALGIDTGGELLVERSDGSVSRVNAGEVSVRGLYSYV